MSTDPRALVRLTCTAMIERLGGFDAACAVLEARWGHPVSKGTLSKKKAGVLDFTVADVWALEEVLGEYPVTDLLTKRRDAGVRAEGGDLLALSGMVSKESGEAVQAVLALLGRGDDGDPAATIKELNEAISAMGRIVDALEAGDD